VFRQIIRSVLLLAVVVVALWFAGKAIFHIGDEAPGKGKGEPVEVVPTP
jgi:hypothetical protein